MDETQFEELLPSSQCRNQLGTRLRKSRADETRCSKVFWLLCSSSHWLWPEEGHSLWAWKAINRSLQSSVLSGCQRIHEAIWIWNVAVNEAMKISNKRNLNELMRSVLGVQPIRSVSRCFSFWEKLKRVTWRLPASRQHFKTLRSWVSYLKT